MAVRTLEPWRKIQKTDPKRLTKLVQAAQALDLLRAEKEKEAKALKDEVKEISDLVLEEFTATELSAIVTPYGTAKRVLKDIPQIDTEAGGWDLLYPHIILPGVEAAFPKSPGAAKLAKKIAQNAQWDLIQKRLGEKACKARWDAKQQIPGVKTFTVVSLKLSDAGQE